VAQGIELRNQYLTQLARLLGTTLEAPATLVPEVPLGTEGPTATAAE
jgi:hypothetical protein